MEERVAYKFNAGRPKGSCKPLTKEISEKVLEGFSKTFVVNLAAKYAKETPYHVKRWLEEGRIDAENEVNSDAAQFFLEMGKTLAEKSGEWIEKIQKCPANYRGLVFLLEKTSPEDFGQESEFAKQLLEMFNNQIFSKGLKNASSERKESIE